ncbi:hypothetical protein ANO11243_035530 [Dothideomycetidae sp. 11243]|nr:hypothetical protein ANO11243_035530 [fungal sp. No.11243]
MAFPNFSISTYAIAGVVFVLVYLLRRAALPQPIPGIPYHKKSAKSIFGDVPSLLRHQARRPEVFDWMTAQARELNSPVYQLFVKPFGRPKVIVLDHREGHDIMHCRSKEFDRSELFADVFSGAAPNHHIVLPTNAQFRAQRKLLLDTMSPHFLNNVAAKHLYKQALNLLELWRVKSRLSGGHAFAVDADINEMAHDAIWAVAFGSEVNTIRSQLELLATDPAVQEPASIEEAIKLPKATLPAEYEAVMVMSDSIEFSLRSPWPRPAHWLYRQTPTYKRANALKENLVQRHLEDAQRRLLKATSREDMIDCACDHMILRERQAAEREGRAPQYDTPIVRDELIGYLVAGHDTTSTTIMWGTKFLADNPSAQSKLRAALHDAYPEAHANGTLPSMQAIIKTDVPYLDAAMEEISRKANTGPGQYRKTTTDVDVLGYTIPKDTDVFLMANGPGFVEANPFEGHIREEQRSKTSREAKGRIPDWDETDISAFKPERWLKNGVFDPLAGPTSPFGAGVRGCFGRKLAMLEMRIMFTLIFWSFDLPQLSKGLSGYGAVDKLTHKPLQCFARPIDLLGKKEDSTTA